MASPLPPDLVGLDDDALVSRARRDDRAAFGELVRRHQRAALRVAAVIAGSSEEAQDIVQDAMVKLHHALVSPRSSYRGEGAVRSWILRVVANEAKNHVRSRVRRNRRNEREAALHLRSLDGVDTVVVERAEVESLAAALSRLRTSDRAVLGCRYVADLSESETAVVLGIPIGTVKSRTSRALARLRVELEATCPTT